MELPDTVFVRRADVCQVYGLSRQAFYKIIDAGKIHRMLLPGAKYAVYLRGEIVRVLGKPVK